MAVEPFVEATVAPAQHLVVVGIAGPERLVWSSRSGGDSFLERAVTTLASALSPFTERNFTEVPLEFILDSSDFFSSDGHKRGFGSSAAIVVALVLGALRALDLPYHLSAGDAAGIDAMQIAIGVHREAQSGRGSGYDVAASINGGTGIFTGGMQPQWKPLDTGHLPRVVLIDGESPVDTRDAISKFNQYRTADPQGFSRFLQNSNAAVESFANAAQSPGWSTLRRAVLDARRTATALGEVIGVHALPSNGTEHLAGVLGGVAKCLGAGDELEAIFLDWTPPAHQSHPQFDTPQPVKPVFPTWL
jgi:phosphomevalonate kinase